MKLLCILSLCVSLVSLALAGYLVGSLHARADAAIEARERQLVARLKPAFFDVYKDFRTTLLPEEENPQRVEDLINPMLRLMTSVNGVEDRAATRLAP